MDQPFWTLSDQGLFEAPGLVALVFHNAYPEGKQGGIELIQHGERVLSCGDVRLDTTPGQWDAQPSVGERTVAAPAVSVPLNFADAGLAYTVRVRPEGESLRISIDLAAPLPADLEGRAGFNLEIYPGAYIGKTFELGGAPHIDTVRQLFPAQAGAPRWPGSAGTLSPAPLGSGSRMVAAPEDPLRRFEIVSETGTLALYDGRDLAQNGWFVLRELIPGGVTVDAVVWRLTPHSVPGWQRAPVIAVSQVGYHPDQEKRAVLELDPRAELHANAVLQRIEASGPVQVLSAAPVPWGRFLCYQYAIFDFTAVQEPGFYQIRYDEHVSTPFAIDRDIYSNGVWQPTLETFFPVQMCHVAVKDRYQTWHGACHLDDALQAPPSHQHFDGYRQHAETETPYAPFTHILHLDRGGWHDAGDYDLAAGSQAGTTRTLALVRELFALDWDQTTVDAERRLVLLHTPDGVPDVVSQVAHGVENLLGGYRAAGHSFHGIIAGTLEQYVHLGDASTMTDNRVYDPVLAPGVAEGERSGTRDDRWAFTNHDTALEYVVAATLATASRVLADFYPALAAEARSVALKVWEVEHSQTPVEQRGGYVPRGAATQEVVAAVELLLTTGELRYREAILASWPTIEARLLYVAGPLARALPAIGDAAFTARLRAALVDALPAFEAELATNPFGVHFRPHIWGIGWQLLGYAVQLYQIWLAFPDLVDREILLRVLNYILGCHPASSTSLVSGVGARSATVAFGVNRADWSYVPGGVVSGPALIRPDFPELKEPWPFLWQQSEYVIGGAADYIFCVLAAERMLNG